MNKQVGGTHYEVLTIQPVKIISLYSLNWFQGEMLKYVSRFNRKNGKQDLLKAKQVSQIAIDNHLIPTCPLFKDWIYKNKNAETLNQYKAQFQPVNYNLNKPGFMKEPKSKPIWDSIVDDIIRGEYLSIYKKIDSLIYIEYGEEDY